MGKAFRSRQMLAALAAAAFMATGALEAVADVRVVVSVKPLHSLVAAVMAGHGEPHLIVEGGSSPHTYALKPSDARELERAQVVFWVGEGLEGFLAKPLEALAGKARLVAVSQTEGLTLHPMREGGAWAAHEEEGEGEHEDEGPDMHILFDPANAAVIAGTIAGALAAADPDNAAAYAANAQGLKERLTMLTEEMEASLAPVRTKPYIVFHDGYQYLEKRFSLNGAGSLTINPEVAPGASRVGEIRALLAERGVHCVFAEPQFSSAIIEAVREGTGARIGVLDPQGADLPKGPDLYFALMRRNVKELIACLGG
jgi:zinc transport system substrate-binding protein